MNSDIVLGVSALIISVSTVLVLTLWSRRRIDHIAQKEATTARELMRELNNGR